jgi:hypothetical protein
MSGMRSKNESGGPPPSVQEPAWRRRRGEPHHLVPRMPPSDSRLIPGSACFHSRLCDTGKRVRGPSDQPVDIAAITSDTKSPATAIHSSSGRTHSAITLVLFIGHPPFSSVARTRPSNLARSPQRFSSNAVTASLARASVKTRVVSTRNRQSHLLHAQPLNSLEQTKVGVFAIEESPSGSCPCRFERGVGVISHLWEGCDGSSESMGELCTDDSDRHHPQP